MCAFLLKSVCLHRLNSLFFRGSFEFLYKMPTKRCSWGQCNSDSGYADRRQMEHVDFVPFPKPIKAWKSVLNGLSFFDLRPHEQLNVSKINAYKYVCTLVRITSGP